MKKFGSLVAHARKFSSLGLVVMMVSPSSCQSVVLAVASKVNGLYDVVALVCTFKNCFPVALFSVIEVPRVKYPDEDSGPRTT